jgi:hypothetical protein
LICCFVSVGCGKTYHVNPPTEHRVFHPSAHNCKCDLPPDAVIQDFWLVGGKLWLEMDETINRCLMEERIRGDLGGN